MIESLVITNSALQDEINIIKDALFQLPEITTNPIIYDKIKSGYENYKQTYDKQINSFSRYIDSS